MIVFQTRDPIDENHPKMLQVLKDFSENSVTGLVVVLNTLQCTSFCSLDEQGVFQSGRSN